jgi:hypothetical protein
VPLPLDEGGGDGRLAGAVSPVGEGAEFAGVAGAEEAAPGECGEGVAVGSAVVPASPPEGLVAPEPAGVPCGSDAAG